MNRSHRLHAALALAVSRILGHASATTTSNVYGYRTDAMLGKAPVRMDNILGRGPVESA